MQNEQRFSSNIGNEYDLFGLSIPYHDDVQTETVATVKVHFAEDKEEIKILEIGFGTGLTSEVILNSDPRVTLVAIDNESEMLNKAQGRLGTQRERLTLEIVDALSFLQTVADRSFDAVVSVWTLHNLESTVRDEIFKEIYRVLRDGGIFVNGDKIAVSDKVEHDEHLHWQLKQFNIFAEAGRPDLRKEWVEHYHEDEHPKRILIEDVMKSTLSNIGFKNCHITKRWYMDAVAVAYK